MDIFPTSSQHHVLYKRKPRNNEDILKAKAIKLQPDCSSVKDKIHFNFIVINKLIQTLNQEVRDKLRHPQWKHFKHMKIDDSDRVRISNIIWRSWHIKFQHNSEEFSRNSPFLDFAIPDIDTTHEHSESVVLEGQYWCRKNVRVALEYANWRQEFMKRSRNLTQKSKVGCYTKVSQLDSESNSLFANTSNDPDFPIFTQNEIDDLVMLDMHDTLFTSNPLHSYSFSHLSDLEYPPQNYSMPYLEQQNIQPALDHLHPYYQGFYDPTPGGENLTSNHTHSQSMCSASLSNISAICDINRLHDASNNFAPTDPEQTVIRDFNETYHNQSLQATQKYRSLEKCSLDRMEWGKGFQSQDNSLSYTVPSQPYIYKPSHLLMKSSEKHLSPSSILEFGYDDCVETNGRNMIHSDNHKCISNQEDDLRKVVESLQLRLMQLEKQVSAQQRMLDPFLEHSRIPLSSSPKSNTTADSLSPVPSSKRFCNHSGSNSPRNTEVPIPWGLPDSSTVIPISVQLPRQSSPISPKYSSDHKRRFGIKSMLEQLEAKLPKTQVDGTRLSNASLLIRAAEFATDLSCKVKKIEKEVSELQSNLDTHHVTTASFSKKPANLVNLPSILSIEKINSQFEEYCKERSMKDPKYYVFSNMMRPIFKQFNTTYSPSSKTEFFDNLKEFSTKSLSFSRMRAELSSTLSQLCRDTQILTRPEMLESDILSLYSK